MPRISEDSVRRTHELTTLQLYSMISQQDNVVSIKLAREGLSDSKAMKMLSILTIIFLPATFFTTLFTTDLVSFQDSSAELEAYIQVVGPLTVVLMILYGLCLGMEPAWSKTHRRIVDLEIGIKRKPYESTHITRKRTKQT